MQEDRKESNIKENKRAIGIIKIINIKSIKKALLKDSIKISVT